MAQQRKIQRPVAKKVIDAGPGKAELESNLSKATEEFNAAKRKLIEAKKALNKFNLKH